MRWNRTHKSYAITGVSLAKIKGKKKPREYERKTTTTSTASIEMCQAYRKMFVLVWATFCSMKFNQNAERIRFMFILVLYIGRSSVVNGGEWKWNWYTIMWLRLNRSQSNSIICSTLSKFDCLLSARHHQFFDEILLSVLHAKIINFGLSFFYHTFSDPSYFDRCNKVKRYII